MSTPRLRAVSRTQGNNADLKEGAVAPRSVELDFEEVPVLAQAFRRMVRNLEFDVCEMAFTTYLCAKAHGKPFTALPVFLVRGLHHGATVYNINSGVVTPKDLEGRRVGVNRGYTVTTGVWARGILQDEHGVDLSRVTWVRSDDEHVSEYRPPPNVADHESEQELADTVASGELAAAVGVKVDHPDVEPLIADPDAAAFQALRRDGLYPINHLVVVRDEVLDAQPSVAADIFNAFAESKQRYVERLRRGDMGEPSATDRLHLRVMEVLDDPLPYGIDPNQAMIDKLVDHAVQQRILDKRPDVEQLFARETHHLTA